MTAAGSHASRTAWPANARAACTHCGLEVPLALDEAGEPLRFCCEGCRLVYSTIHSCGLDRYYALRQRLGVEGRRASVADSAFIEFDDPAFLAAFAGPAAGAPAVLRVELLLEGVHCAACLWLVERLPHLLDGVRSARLDLRRSVVSVEWDPARVALSRVARMLAGLGYRPHPVTSSAARDGRRRQDREYLTRIGVAAACAGNAMLLAFALYSGASAGTSESFAAAFRWISVGLGLVALLWPGRIFLHNAVAAIRARIWHLDMPIALALVVGNAAGVVAALRGTHDLYVDSLTMLIFLLLVGRWLQVRQQRHALDAVELLFSLTPGVAHLVETSESGDGVRDVAVQALQRGHVVEVRPQETVPIDGVIVSGATSTDSSILTGESRPVPAAMGQDVLAGAVNLDSTIRVRATAVGRETRAGRMMATIEECSSRRTPVLGSAQRLAAPFVVTVLGLAAITFAIHAPFDAGAALRHAVALLVATCPCAVALATPLVVSIAVGRSAQAGVLIKGGDVFERMARPGLIVLDKTGTVTTGAFQVLEWTGDPSLRSVVAGIETGSTHPIAAALARPAGDGPLFSPAVPWPGPIEHVLGQGVVARDLTRTVRIGSVAWVGQIVLPIERWPRWAVDAVAAARAGAQTPVVVAVDRRISAVAALGDQIRPDAAPMLDALRRDGWRTALLSGDDPAAVRAVATQLGIDQAMVWGGASPEVKRARIVALAGQAPVVMVGDGVNDAAALASATVGVAVRGGAEASLAAADVYIERGGLAPIATLQRASRRVLGVIRLCLAMAIVYNVLAAALAMAGLLSPLLAAAMMPASSITILTIAIRARTFPVDPHRDDARDTRIKWQSPRAGGGLRTPTSDVPTAAPGGPA